MMTPRANDIASLLLAVGIATLIMWGLMQATSHWLQELFRLG